MGTWVKRPWYQMAIYGSISSLFVASMGIDHFIHESYKEYIVDSLNLTGFAMLILYQYNNKWGFGIVCSSVLTLVGLIILLDKLRRTRKTSESKDSQRDVYNS